MELWVAFLGGGAGAAIVGIIGQLLVARQARKYAKEDTETEELKQLKAGVMWVLYDRIRYLGLAYMKDGAVDFDDRRILHEMHRSYSALGGNGDLTIIMAAVDKLPLKGGAR